MTDNPAEGTSIRVSRLRFDGTFTEPGRVSMNWGPTLRGGFGASLRDVSCTLDEESCTDCSLAGKCAYGYLFETPIDTSAEVMSNYTHAPHPFILEPPSEQSPKVQEGDAFGVSVVLLGQGIDYLPHVFLALRRLGERGLGRDRVSFDITQVVSGDGDVLFKGPGEGSLGPAPNQRLNLSAQNTARATFLIELLTPLRLKNDGRIARSVSPFALIQSLTRRVFLLHHFHGEGDAQLSKTAFLDAADGTEMADSSFRWVDKTRYSTRQQRKIPIGGIVGRMECHGDWGILGPLLRAGEYVHVGKNTSLGMGRIRVWKGTQS